MGIQCICKLTKLVQGSQSGHNQRSAHPCDLMRCRLQSGRGALPSVRWLPRLACVVELPKVDQPASSAGRQVSCSLTLHAYGAGTSQFVQYQGETRVKWVLTDGRVDLCSKVCCRRPRAVRTRYPVLCRVHAVASSTSSTGLLELTVLEPASERRICGTTRIAVFRGLN